jgi:hypothetical protein
MTLATGQRARMASRVGKMRLGAVRLGYYQPWIKVLINGVDRTSLTRVSECTITDELNNEPNIATVRVSGFTPAKGQEIKVYMGDTTVTHQLFGGVILSVDQTYEAERPANVIWVCQCIDYTWLLNRRKVFKRYTNQSASAIVTDLISTFTSGFTVSHVVSGLATIDEITFTAEDVTDALTRIAERIGGYWYVDYVSDLHFFLTEAESTVTITTAAPRGSRGHVKNSDLSQVATRILCAGDGSTAVVDTAAGTTVLAVDSGAPFSSGGGTVKINHQRVTYTGKDTFTRGVTLTSLAGTVFSGSGDFPILTGDTITIAGANEPEYNGTFVATFGDGANFRYTITGTPASPATGAISVTMDASGRGSTVTAAASPGATALTVANLRFDTSGGWVVVDGQLLSYTTTLNTPIRLSGIPASGFGSIVSPIAIGAAVLNAAMLTGIPGSGAGAITDTVHAGDPVDVLVTAEDAAAQAVMAALEGGDGIHEMYIADGRISLTEATARATAELRLRKDPLDTLRFESRDPTLQSGRDVSITLISPAISGTFRIQRVTLSELGLSGPTGYLFPLRDVEASSQRYSFEDVLRRLKEGAT